MMKQKTRDVMIVSVVFFMVAILGFGLAMFNESYYAKDEVVGLVVEGDEIVFWNNPDEQQKEVWSVYNAPMYAFGVMLDSDADLAKWCEGKENCHEIAITIGDTMYTGKIKDLLTVMTKEGGDDEKH